MPENDLPSLSGKEYLIMNLLISSREPMYGLSLVEKSDGALKRGTVYVTLSRLEEKGYISSKREEERPGVAMPRRLYRPTGQGAKVFNALSSVGGRAWLREVMA